MRTGVVTALNLAAAGLWWSAYFAAPAVAMHEVDHRFTVDGYVCGTDGRPVQDASVLVKDVRVSVGTTTLTDDRGYYKATLHLHNDNLGDPVLVTAQDQEQHTKVQFDPKDVKTERKVRVTFGSGCESATGDVPGWVYYGAGLGIAAVAAFAGAKLIRNQRRRLRQRGKGQRKHYRS